MSQDDISKVSNALKSVGLKDDGDDDTPSHKESVKQWITSKSLATSSSFTPLAYSVTTGTYLVHCEVLIENLGSFCSIHQKWSTAETEAYGRAWAAIQRLESTGSAWPKAFVQSPN